MRAPASISSTLDQFPYCRPPRQGRSSPAMRRAVLLLSLLACARGAQKPSYGAPGVQAAFDLDTDPARPGFFWDLPWPSDLRLTADGKPQLASFPNPRGLPLIETFRRMAMERGGSPVLPVGYCRFDA